MFQLRRPRRPGRSSEWTSARAVTFIVTLAASRSVTLAARNAGMSRKSAYALKNRDPAFAAAWHEAVRTGASARREEPAPSLSGRSRLKVNSNEVDEIDYTRDSPGQGDITLRRSRRIRRAERAPGSLISARRESKRSVFPDSGFRQNDRYMRDLLFAQLAHNASRQ